MGAIDLTGHFGTPAWLGYVGRLAPFLARARLDGKCVHFVDTDNTFWPFLLASRAEVPLQLAFRP